jgi:hypothetical protein
MLVNIDFKRRFFQTVLIIQNKPTGKSIEEEGNGG